MHGYFPSPVSFSLRLTCLVLFGATCPQCLIWMQVRTHLMLALRPLRIKPRVTRNTLVFCDDIRDLRVSKKEPVVFVYSVKDEMLKIFF